MPPKPLSKRHAYTQFKIVEIIEETSDARTFVLEPPRHLRASFSYLAGQYLTIRLRLGMDRYVRCYSMSSSPDVDALPRITIKRVTDGLVSNFMNDMMKVGYSIESMPPSGEFVLHDRDEPIVALASGSGITPVISIIKTALATTDRSIRLLFANASRSSVIFADTLAQLAESHPGRLDVTHHIYEEAGYATVDTVTRFLGTESAIDTYVCGSRSFTATVSDAIAGLGLTTVHYETFTPIDGDDVGGGDIGVDPEAARAAIDASLTESLVVRIRGTEHTVAYQPGDTLLVAARKANLTPPFACENGHCGACVAWVEDGEAVMTSNRALEPEEIADGWVVTCRAHPISPTVTYEFPD